MAHATQEPWRTPGWILRSDVLRRRYRRMVAVMSTVGVGVVTPVPAAVAADGSSLWYVGGLAFALGLIWAAATPRMAQDWVAGPRVTILPQILGAFGLAALGWSAFIATAGDSSSDDWMSALLLESGVAAWLGGILAMLGRTFAYRDASDKAPEVAPTPQDRHRTWDPTDPDAYK